MKPFFYVKTTKSDKKWAKEVNGIAGNKKPGTCVPGFLFDLNKVRSAYFTVSFCERITFLFCIFTM